MALQREVWIADIQENLFQGNDHLSLAINHDQFVEFDTVHIPQAGANPAVQVNRTQLPAAITKRTDADFTYKLDEYTTDPVFIRNLDELQISYDKRRSVLAQHQNLLNEQMGSRALINWAPDGSNSDAIVLTSGSDSSRALAPGASGTRKEPTIEDISKLAEKLDKDNVGRDNRYLEMPVSMYYQLFNVQEIISAEKYGQANLPSGVVNRLFNFNILVRPDVTVYDDSDQLKAFGAAGGANDNLGAIAWHRDYVARALGTIDVFSDTGDDGNGKPEFYGSLFSALVMFGAEKMRTDDKGIAALVQEA